jgi:hypothetical protein
MRKSRIGRCMLSVTTPVVARGTALKSLVMRVFAKEIGMNLMISDTVEILSSIKGINLIHHQ